MKTKQNRRCKTRQKQPQPWIEAELLRPFVAQPDIHPDDWHRMLFSRYELVWAHRAIKLGFSKAGVIQLSLPFADFLAITARSEFCSAIARTLIDEAWECEAATLLDQPNQDLLRFRPLAIDEEWVDGLTLHEFLRVETDFETWFDRLKADHAMQYHRDIARVVVKNGRLYLTGPKNAGGARLAFATDLAMRVAMAEQTVRGQAFSEVVQRRRALGASSIEGTQPDREPSLHFLIR